MAFAHTILVFTNPSFLDCAVMTATITILHITIIASLFLVMVTITAHLLMIAETWRWFMDAQIKLLNFAFAVATISAPCVIVITFLIVS